MPEAGARKSTIPRRRCAAHVAVCPRFRANSRTPATTDEEESDRGSLRNYGEADPKRRTAAGRARELDASLVALDDHEDGGEPESGPLALWFRREEGLEDRGLDLDGYALAAVGHRDLDLAVAGRGRELQGAAAFHGVDGVDHEVDESGLELVGDAPDGGEGRGELLAELDAALEDLVVAQLQAALDDVFDGEGDRLLLRGTAEGEQALGEARDPLRPHGDRGKHLLLGRAVGQGLQQLEVAHDVGERRVELVGDPGRHLPDGGQLLGLEELLLGGAQLFDALALALEQEGVLDGEGGMAGQGLHRLEAVRAEGGRGLLVVDVDGADGPGG